jgi:PIN domain nuclease of toxin-antitoxin system
MAVGGLLLDTCTVIYSALGSEISVNAKTAMDEAADVDGLNVSMITAWEIGMSIAKGRIASPLSAQNFFNVFVEDTNIARRELTAKILIDASYLPGALHGDPMDRIIIATAREHDLTIVTRDRAILAYGAAGHVKTLAC